MDLKFTQEVLSKKGAEKESTERNYRSERTMFMSILRQLNDEVMEKLRVGFVPIPEIDPGNDNTFNVGDDFTITIVVENISGQYPQIDFLNIAIEVYPSQWTKIKSGKRCERQNLGDLSPGQKKTVLVQMTADKCAEELNSAWDWAEQLVGDVRIAADTKFRCKDLDVGVPPIIADINP